VNYIRYHKLQSTLTDRETGWRCRSSVGLLFGFLRHSWNLCRRRSGRNSGSQYGGFSKCHRPLPPPMNMVY